LTEIHRTERCEEVSSKEREPNWRLVRGTWRSLDVEERIKL